MNTHDSKQTPQGFTLLELLVVVGLMSVLIGMVSFVFFGNKQDITTFHLSRELIAKKLNEVQTLALKSRQKARLAIFYDYIDDSSGERLHQEAIGELNRQGRFVMTHIYNEDNKEWVVAPIEPLLLPEGITVDFGTSKEDFLSDDENNLITWPKAGSALESSYVKGTWLVFTFGKDGKTFKEGRKALKSVKGKPYTVEIRSPSGTAQKLVYDPNSQDPNSPWEGAIPIGPKYFKVGSYSGGDPKTAAETAAEVAFWENWHANHDLLATNAHFFFPLKPRLLYMSFGGKKDVGNAVEKCLKYAVGWKDITGHIYTYYVDSTSQVQSFQWYDPFSSYLYRITLDNTKLARPIPTDSTDKLVYVASMVEVYKRKGSDESDIKFPVVGPNDFIFPAHANPVFSDADKVKAHLETIFHAVALYSPVSGQDNTYTMRLTPSHTDYDTSLVPDIRISWQAVGGTTPSFDIGDPYISFGLMNERSVMVSETPKDSSPIFAITLKADKETTSTGSTSDTTIGLLTTPQGSLLYFGKPAELANLKSTLAAPSP